MLMDVHLLTSPKPIVKVPENDEFTAIITSDKPTDALNFYQRSLNNSINNK